MLYIIVFILGMIIGFTATACGVAALIHDGQLMKTPKWYAEELKKKQKSKEE